MVAFLATALFADRFAAAAPAEAPRIVQVARNFTRRLVINLRRTIPSATLRYSQRIERTIAVRPSFAGNVAPVIHSSDFSPFAYRLPPPVI